MQFENVKMDTLLKFVKQMPLLRHLPDEVLMVQIALIHYVIILFIYVSPG